MRKTNPGILYVEEAHQPIVPVVFDSPHSGRTYPNDFNCKVPESLIRCAEDMFVDELFEEVPFYGAELLAALFPRSYIDPNRSLGDVDENLKDLKLSDPLARREITKRSHGLIWHTCPPDMRMYDRKVTREEVNKRIDNYYCVYHKALKSSLSRLYEQFGHVWHVNCHSMPAVASADGQSKGGAEFVLGDRDGTTCAPEFTLLIQDTLKNLGYSVKINIPYKGVELVRAYSNPKIERHSIQIEICRSLYMDETSFRKTDGFGELKSNLTKLAAVICSYAHESSLDITAGNQIVY